MSAPSTQHRNALLLTTVAGVALVAVHAAAQADRRSAPTAEQLANMSISGIEKTAVSLRQGVWEGKPSARGSRSRPRIELVSDFRIIGDLTGDGNDEAVVLLSSSSGGSGTFVHLAVAAWRGTAVENVATAAIGDRVQVRAGQILGGRIELDVVQAVPDDPMCCPSQTATRSWRLTTTGLLEEAVKNVGTLSLRDLEGREWLLSHLTRNEAVPVGPRVTLKVDGNRFSGSGGCNRYFCEVKRIRPGEIAVGPVAGTRMACGDEVDRLENRFQTALQKVTRYGFVAGKLALTYRDGDVVRTMLFEAR